MASSFLSPPNSYSLSDQAIGGVRQRVSALHTRLGLNHEHESREVDRYTKPRQAFYFDSYATDKSSISEQLPPSSSTSRKCLPDLDSLANLATQCTADTTALQSEPAPSTVPVSERKTRMSASRRERCRINQARYRKRQLQHADDLSSNIRELQEEIQELETKRHNLMRRTPTSESVWVVATEYFRLFRNGYMVPLMTPALSSSSSTSNAKNPRRPQFHAQLDFLDATMAPDVTDGSLSDAEAMVEHWRLLSLYCGDVQVQLKRLEQVSADSLMATTVTSLTLTENTLRHVFPHLVVDQVSTEGEASPTWLPLADKIKNQRLVVRGSMRFDWDATSRRVARLEPKMDLLAPMLGLLGSLEDVTRVFDNALMTLDGKFISSEVACE